MRYTGKQLCIWTISSYNITDHSLKTNNLQTSIHSSSNSNGKCNARRHIALLALNVVLCSKDYTRSTDGNYKHAELY